MIYSLSNKRLIKAGVYNNALLQLRNALYKSTSFVLYIDF